MDIKFHSADKSGIRLDCIIMLTFEGSAASLGERIAGSPVDWLGESVALADYSGKKNELTVCYGPSSSVIARVILVGLGQRENLTLAQFRQAVASAVRRCKTLKTPRIGMLLADQAAVAEVLGKSRNDIVQETLAAAYLSLYSCNEYKSAEAKAKGRKENEASFFMPDSLTLIHSDKPVPASLRSVARLAEAEAAGVYLARNLVNAPSNVMTPARLSEEAVALAKRHGFGCRVMHKAELVKLGMEAFLAVNEGSAKDPRFIVLEYMPKNGKKRSPLVLVGKGITFDSGGISLKPAAGMHLMKGDMAGAAAVLGAFEALGRAQENISQPVVGLMPCTENMPDGAAVRPGDVVTTMSGKTVEILNTDAEGRLILCDALTYAQKNWTPLAVVDIATLTGACMVALGRGAAGLFTENENLRDLVMSVGEDVGDTFWPMPLWGHLAEGLKSDVADIANVGAREGGAISAALFLQAFVEKNVPWAHLDMAGAGISEKDAPLCPRGATGFGVRTLFGMVRKISERAMK
ncbi:MAG: Cytosol aminopeptidase [Desulfovibrio sp.]